MSAPMSLRTATAADREDGLPWASVGDDDAETIELDARKDERRVSDVREACRLLLADLKQFEGWPEPMARPDIDRKQPPLAQTLKG